MLTSSELELEIERLTVSKEALTAFVRRVAGAFSRALTIAGVEFHAINGPDHYHGDGFDEVARLSARPNDTGWDFQVSDTMKWETGDAAPEMISCTSLSDSELARIADLWATNIAARSKRVAFANLYKPKAVEMAERYNDLRVAFRVIRAWDPVFGGYILRFDSVFKKLDV
jgi:hypothetical protein